VVYECCQFVQLWLLKRKECDGSVRQFFLVGGDLGVWALSAFVLWYGTLLITTTR
jgi:hypothetical protein